MEEGVCLLATFDGDVDGDTEGDATTSASVEVVEKEKPVVEDTEIDIVDGIDMFDSDGEDDY